MRRLACAVALLLLVPAGADAAVCSYEKPEPKLSRAEERLRSAIGTRELYGLPHGRRYVRRVHADEANVRRGAENPPFIPVTARESAYLGDRLRITDPRETRRVDAYMRRHRKVFGAPSVGDDYPRRPYLQIRVTRDVARHRAAIRRLYRPRFEIKRVAFSKPELTRIYRSIDGKALEAEGIHLLDKGQRADGIELSVATTRKDVRAVVRRLYGPAVTVDVEGPTPTFFSCTSPERYELEPDGRTLRVHFTHSSSIRPKEVEVVESAGEVRLGVVYESDRGGLINADQQPYTLRVTLAAPLGDRAVRSIQTAEPVPRG
jgi:hypothetical protein